MKTIKVYEQVATEGGLRKYEARDMEISVKNKEYENIVNGLVEAYEEFTALFFNGSDVSNMAKIVSPIVYKGCSNDAEASVIDDVVYDIADTDYTVSVLNRSLLSAIEHYSEK